MFYADLHIHSKYSRATSSDCDLEHLSYWGRRKGIELLGTGDFTHPRWLAEIKEKLVPAEGGLFRLRPDLERAVERMPGDQGGDPTRFMLEVEISTIYKRGEKCRKVHHLVYVPHLPAAEKLIDRLSRIGNLASDGRPILGLDSRDLLEITLECGEGAYLVPAHIWTPWFAAMGSKSGFDSIEDCYGDLASNIFAVETGLSSDPPMNWRLSILDRFTLVSNSDAHSPPKVGREASLFDTDLDYFSIREALESGRGYQGTVEFFPEEGKYHMDGHRSCGVRLSPEETKEHEGRCPSCGSLLTVGVMHRVNELADRPELDSPPAGRPIHRSRIPLPEVLSEIQGVGPNSKAVRASYEKIIAKLGAELFILDEALVEDIRKAGSSLLAEAVGRMREGRVIREAGYDGEYGKIKLFNEGELRRQKGVQLLFDNDADEPKPPKKAPVKSKKEQSVASVIPPTPQSLLPLPGPMPGPGGILAGLDPDQRKAAEITEGPLLIVAGPGTGKTRTLTHRIIHLIEKHGAQPEACLAITFTNRAAGEMRERLKALSPVAGHRVPVMTFHALGLFMLREHAGQLGLPNAFNVASEAERLEVLHEMGISSTADARRILKEISLQKRIDAFPSNEESLQVRAEYDEILKECGFVDFDDLIRRPLELFQMDAELSNEWRNRFKWVSVDEYQDIDRGQYNLVRQLVSADGNFCVIGDPDQAIYGFRGADVGFFQRFREDYPKAQTVQLTRNYRSSPAIVKAALEVVAPTSLVENRTLEALGRDRHRIVINESATDLAEAEFVAHSIEQALGGSSLFSMDSGRSSGEGEERSLSDFAVLYRTESQAGVIGEALARLGIPFQKRSHKPLLDDPVVMAMLKEVQVMSENESLVDRLRKAAEAEGLKARASEATCMASALTPIARGWGANLDGFMNDLAVCVDADLWDPRADRVSLLTLHASKGLEFPVVFMVGCEDGLAPLRFGEPSEEDLAEERRLFFVGMTRAKERLFLSYARSRRWRGTRREALVSPFVRSIGAQWVIIRKQKVAAVRPRPRHVQLELF